jgi:macrolide phosphotransferase
VSRSALNLAALSTVAVPGMDVVDVRPVRTDGDDDVAVVIDAARRHWVVRSPQDAAAGARLEAEMVLVGSLVPLADDGTLPFAVPEPAGFAPLPEGGRAVVHPEVPGRPLHASSMQPGPGLAAAVGRAIAAIHELPAALVEDAGLPSYTAAEYRERRLAEVDEAARTGRVPARLLRRWEAALENVALWRFQPTVVHGDLDDEHILVAQNQVNGIVGWGEARVADPADDLAWLLATVPPAAVESILEAYQLRRTEQRDGHLVERALLAGELAVARWLMHGVRTGKSEVVDDAVEMLLDLDQTTSGADAAEDD